MNKIYNKYKKNSAGAVAKWIVNTILKLDTKNLLEFYNLIRNELIKRGTKEEEL